MVFLRGWGLHILLQWRWLSGHKSPPGACVCWGAHYGEDWPQHCPGAGTLLGNIYPQSTQSPSVGPSGQWVRGEKKPLHSSWSGVFLTATFPFRCPYQDDRYLTTLVPVTGSSGLQFPTHYKRFVVKMFTFVDPASLAPLQETVCSSWTLNITHIS